MKKKTYRKPDLKTCKIEIGVFGDYGNGRDHDTGNTLVPKTNPVATIEELGLRME